MPVVQRVPVAAHREPTTRFLTREWSAATTVQYSPISLPAHSHYPHPKPTVILKPQISKSKTRARGVGSSIPIRLARPCV